MDKLRFDEKWVFQLRRTRFSTGKKLESILLEWKYKKSQQFQYSDPQTGKTAGDTIISMLIRG
ncbi:hypothetical protein X546_25170 [Brevibacillus borstelensis cifa_chp40]|nr:hypothetical protein X546_25170 [Brevibacillus borstelensis cifa_chp40]GED55522.1 hypothetical protein BBO01nite_47630 [Brevibacillus borstelensis]